jgi:cytoskeletal protein CcmA (bactofilin family)
MKGTMAMWNKQEPAAAPGGAGLPLPAPLSVPEREDLRGMATTTREASPELPASGGGVATSDLLLGAGAEFEGKLTFKGTVRIDAKFTGSIVTNDVLVVGEHARMDAEITCGTVVVHGEVNGNIKARNAVELYRSAKVHGNIETPSLMVEKGVLLQGEVKMAQTDKDALVAPFSATGPVALQ